jgi:uncharacterized protein YbjT (DUF2867 family)
MERILVTRATGRVGAAVVRQLVRRGHPVRAATHEPARAAAMFGSEIEIAELDYTREETYDAATGWAHRVFLVPPPFDARADESLTPFFDHAVAGGARHVVLLSAMALEGFEHVPLHRVERHVRDSGVPFTLLRPNWFMQNFLADFLAVPIRERGAFMVSTGDGAISFVDIRDVIDVAVEVLSSDAHHNTAPTLTGPEALTHHQVARILSYAAGREIRYTPVDNTRMRRALRDAGWSADQLDVAIGLFRRMREGDRAEVTGDVAALLGRPPNDFASFAREHASAWQGSS